MNKVNKGSQKDRSTYKETLNLLQTEFGMRANATLREPELQAFWTEKKIDFELGLKNAGETFTLHDGPPYANGTLHMGHALNKVLKDIINKYKIMEGKKVCYVPGWDCHGLPIELKVLQALDKSQRAALTPIKLRKKAAAYAKKQVSNQMDGFKRWGIWGDWDNPYLTLDKQFESSQIKLFGEMVFKGYIYRGLKPVHWSPSSQTALAEAELEYPNGHVSQSVYVGFKVNQIPKILAQEISNQAPDLFDSEGILKEVKLLIWTTTPWTLPANEAISVNKKLDYVIAERPDKSFAIMANDLLEKVSNTLGIDFKKRLLIKGSLLDGVIYNHPLYDKKSPVVLGGDYITIDSGTGLVHTAPGHGVDDFNTGKKYNLPISCPVDEKGFLTNEAGKFKGLNVLKDANKIIIDDLINEEALIKEIPYEHRYPYDWRTKKPTIFRATEQWFASVEGFREKALSAIKDVTWLPLSGKNRIDSMVRERGDWCISRQRTWGLPIPVFYEKNGKDILLNKETISHIADLFLTHGADIWWEYEVSKLLPPSYVNEADRWQKGTDTMDVWFDSGSSWSSVISKKNNFNYPADLYLEGSDQHRGWFQSSLLTSVAVNEHAPFKKVLTHGFALDENGRKMSKSLGNIIDPLVIINGGSNKKLDPAYGADVLRLWVSSVDYSADVPIGSNILKQISDVYRKIRNTSRYLLGNIYDFDKNNDAIDISELPLLDKWMLNRTAEVIDEITDAFSNFEFSKFFQTIQNFCVVDLSNFYLDIAKDRLYVSSKSDFRRRSCQTVLSLVIETISGLIAPVLCHMAEDIWQNIPYSLEEISVFKRGWPKAPEIWRNNSLNEHVVELRKLRTVINRMLESCRNKQELGSSLEASVRVDITDEKVRTAIEWLSGCESNNVDVLRDWFLVSSLQIGGEPWAEVLVSEESDIASVDIAKARGFKCERCWHYEIEMSNNKIHTNICKRCEKVVIAI
ncbi:isoleucine--tRNA ligase [Prochlorococcus marinus]|uniref:Isoleucine--tRNA ligase n=1 Tax=Prochlorococcus marinus XMU1408 TaxID=2213228 RepID=A0A318REL4_PROMR|nr:isoleucine--tRNA ligase [Prochlorococcus marinus]MBW3041297.1 isoleucine--tRNA ligase [Prochlorococcus marinus str. XMU1408]PYE02473.1 isoleucine--tRNA ligase [Prochlorococcus marinus XMU1408]